MIRDHIKTMVGDQVIVMVKGTVTSVDKDTDTMTFLPLDGTADYANVFLEALNKTDDGQSDIVRYPAIGAYAVIGLIGNDDTNTFLIKASKYESVFITLAQSVKITASGNGKVTIDAKSITLNGGNNNGLVNIMPLITKINKLENLVNQFLSVFKVHIHPVAGASTGPTATPTPAIITPLTKKADLEDTKITH